MTRQVSASAPARAPLASDRSLAADADGWCILQCVDLSTDPPSRRPRMKDSTLCSVCAHRIESQAKKGARWRERRRRVLGAWLGGLDLVGAIKRRK